MAFQNHEGQVRSFQMPAYFWYRRAERSREEGQPVRAQSQSGARDLLTDREGACILVYSDRAEKVDFSAEP